MDVNAKRKRMETREHNGENEEEKGNQKEFISTNWKVT